MRGKKGQFYLIAAVIIIGLIASLASLSTYLNKESITQTENIGEELKIESRYLMDYFLYNELSLLEKQNILSNFSKNYSEYVGKDKSFYFIFGDLNNIMISGYQNEDREIKLQNLTITSTEGYFEEMRNSRSATISLYIDSNKYDFEFLRDSSFNFNFVILQEIDDEEYIFTG